jgi:hypothetical protein
VKNFYLISSTPGAADTILYTGTVDNIDNIAKEQARVKTLANAVLSGTTPTPAASTATAATTTGTATAATLQTGKSGKPSLLDTLTTANKEGINSIKKTEEIQPVDIPGYTFDANASSVKSGVKPVSDASRNKAESEISNKLSQTSGTQTTLKK